MSLYLAVFSILVMGLLVAAVLYVTQVARRRRQGSMLRTQELHTLWARSAPTGRVELFRRRLHEHDESPQADRPGSEAARAEIAFYLGCAHLAERNPAGAARMFQVAYHADPRLKTALVLAFACLKVAGERCLEESRVSPGSADATCEGTVLVRRCGNLA